MAIACLAMAGGVLGWTEVATAGPCPTAPPIPLPGQQVAWTAANSPYRVCTNLTIPASSTVVVEPGVRVDFDADTTLAIAGDLQASGTASNMISFVAAAIFPPMFEVTGTTDLSYCSIRGQVRPSSGGDLTFQNCAFSSPGAIFSLGLGSDPNWAPPFVNVSQCVFANAALDANGCVLAVRDTSINQSYIRSVLSYDLLDNVSVDAAPNDAVILEHDDQPMYIDRLSVTNTNGAALALGGRNHGYLIGPQTTLLNNMLPVRIGEQGGGLLPGSVLPSSGNANNYVELAVATLNFLGPVTWAPVGIPYVIPGFPHVVGVWTILPQTTIQLGPSSGIVVDAGILKARGLPGLPVTFERSTPGQPWNFLGIQRPGSRIQHCVVDGSQHGLSAGGTVTHVESCVFQNNGWGAQVSGLGLLRIRGSEFHNNAEAIRTDPDLLSSGGVDLNGHTNPNLLSGNGLAVNVLSPAPGPIDAEENWWGHASGPNSPNNPGGQGDVIGGTVPQAVDVVPFLTVQPNGLNAPPVVQLEAPSFLLQPGQRVVLNWSSIDSDAIVAHRVLFSPAGNATFSIVATLPGAARAYEWTVPNIGFQVTGAPAYVRVVAVDSAGQEGWDEAFFTIPANDAPAGTLTILSDFTGPFSSGQLSPLCYETHNTDVSFAGVSAFLFLDADERTIPLGGLATTSGCLGDVRMPLVSTDNARIGVVMQGNCCNRVKWFFTNTFSIRPDPRIGDAPPAITLLTPTPGSSFPAGEVVPLSWTATDDEQVRSFAVQASFDQGETWHSVAKDLPGTATTYSWKLPTGDAIADVRVRGISTDLRFQNSSATHTISITPALQPGDIDGDGDVDGTDVGLFVGILVGTNQDQTQVDRSDLNGDGAANGSDCQPFVNAIVGP